MPLWPRKPEPPPVPKPSGGIFDVFKIDYAFWKKAADAAQAAIQEFVRRMQ